MLEKVFSPIEDYKKVAVKNKKPTQMLTLRRISSQDLGLATLL